MAGDGEERALEACSGIRLGSPRETSWRGAGVPERVGIPRRGRRDPGDAGSVRAGSGKGPGQWVYPGVWMVEESKRGREQEAPGGFAARPGWVGRSEPGSGEKWEASGLLCRPRRRDRWRRRRSSGRGDGGAARTRLQWRGRSRVGALCLGRRITGHAGGEHGVELQGGGRRKSRGCGPTSEW